MFGYAKERKKRERERERESVYISTIFSFRRSAVYRTFIY